MEGETDFRVSFLEWPGVTLSPATDHPDGALVKAAQDGDRGAFGLLYMRYARMVHGILLGRVPHMAVEDLVQDVFLLALPRLGSLRDVSRFGGWLAAIARNRAADFHRQTRLGRELQGQVGDRAAETHPPSHADQADALAILDAIRALPEAYRETLILRLVEGMAGPEIAACTGLTHGSVRVNLHRGMQQLREVLGLKAEAGKPAAGAG